MKIKYTGKIKKKYMFLCINFLKQKVDKSDFSHMSVSDFFNQKKNYHF